jgi:hypothetical protein
MTTENRDKGAGDSPAGTRPAACQTLSGRHKPGAGEMLLSAQSICSSVP